MSRKTRQSPLRAARPVGHTLLVPDPHCPYHADGTLEFLGDLKSEFKPDRTLFLGDVFDHLTSSRYGTHSAAKGADDEWAEACDFVLELAAMFPVAEVLIGNHDARPAKRASEVGIPTELIRPFNEVPRLAKALRLWRWCEKIEINADTVAVHGEGFGGNNPGEAAVLAYRKNVVMAHLHTRFGVNYHARGDWVNWSFNTGCLIDPNSPANGYAKHHQKRTIRGAGVLLNGRTPLAIPKP